VLELSGEEHGNEDLEDTSLHRDDGDDAEDGVRCVPQLEEPLGCMSARPTQDERHNVCRGGMGCHVTTRERLGGAALALTRNSKKATWPTTAPKWAMAAMVAPNWLVYELSCTAGQPEFFVPTIPGDHRSL
jgi:hypothetical protein